MCYEIIKRGVFTSLFRLAKWEITEVRRGTQCLCRDPFWHQSTYHEPCNNLPRRTGSIPVQPLTCLEPCSSYRPTILILVVAYRESWSNLIKVDGHNRDRGEKMGISRFLSATPIISLSFHDFVGCWALKQAFPFPFRILQVLGPSRSFLDHEELRKFRQREYIHCKDQQV